MRIIARQPLREFASRHPDAAPSIAAWYAEAKTAQWRGPADVKAVYRSASILKSGRVVFNIAGNKYRLVVKIRYDLGIVYIRFIGTHAQYDTISAEDI